MVTLRVRGLHWVKGVPDDPLDQCAHGAVEFCVDEGDDGTTVHLSTQGRNYSPSEGERRAAVLSFCDQIEEFYARRTPKGGAADEDDRKGWAARVSVSREKRHGNASKEHDLPLV